MFPLNRDRCWLILLMLALLALPSLFVTPDAKGATYHFDSVVGSDENPGSVEMPLKSLAKVADLALEPGDSVLFKRGSEFEGGIAIWVSGEEGAPITFAAYGMGELPRFSNPEYASNFGRVFDVSGSYLVFRKLLFHDCATRYEEQRRAHPLGAIFLNEGTDHNSVIDCEFTNMPVGLRDNGDHGVITGNYFHDATKPLNQYWGPMGVVVNGSYTEIAHNTFINVRSTGTFWGADGGAIELDNHEHQEGIRVHHNFSRCNSGFLECYEHGSYDDVVIAFNVSDDYEKFLGLNGTRGWKVTNNTVFRTLDDGHGFSDFIWFREWYNPNQVEFTNNIFIARDSDMSIYGDWLEGLPQDGESQESRNNLYWSFSGAVDVGKPLGDGDLVADPMFLDLDNRDLRLRKGSPAIDAGAAVGYSNDVEGNGIIGTPDMGAYEFTGAPRVEALFNGKDLDDWTFFLDDKDGPVDPSDVWSVKDGVIRCSGEPFGYLRTKKTYRNFKLTVEWRWPEEPGNSGVFFRIYGEDKLWPMCAEAQLMHERAGDLIAFGRELEGGEQDGDISFLGRPGESLEKEPGEWNRYEITCDRQDIVITLNGQEVNRTDSEIPYEGSIGLQSEGAPIEFLRVELTRLD